MKYEDQLLNNEIEVDESEAVAEAAFERKFLIGLYLAFFALSLFGFVSETAKIIFISIMLLGAAISIKDHFTQKSKLNRGLVISYSYLIPLFILSYFNRVIADLVLITSSLSCASISVVYFLKYDPNKAMKKITFYCLCAALGTVIYLHLETIKLFLQ